MNHPTDDDLILHFYGEHPAAEGARIDAHLAVCAGCGESWRELRETLQLVDTARVPEPAASFERVMWARIAPALHGSDVGGVEAGRDRTVVAIPRRSPWTTWRWLVPATGLAAAVVAAVVLPQDRRDAPGRGDSPVPVTAPATQTATSAQESGDGQSRRVLLTALNDHFAQTEVLLVELLNRPEGDRALDFERGTAGDLLADGRLYRLTAEHTGEHRFANVLDELESVLVEVARSPEKVKRQDMKVLRSRIDRDGLLFKVRAVTNEIRDRQQEMFTVTANEGSL